MTRHVPTRHDVLRGRSVRPSPSPRVFSWCADADVPLPSSRRSSRRSGSCATCSTSRTRAWRTWSSAGKTRSRRRALERFGANDDVSNSLEGAWRRVVSSWAGASARSGSSCASIGLDRDAPAGTPSNSVSVTREDERAQKEGSATADTRHRPRRLAEMETGSPDRSRRLRPGAAARRRRRRGRPAAFAPFRGVPEDGVAREALRDAFEDLLVRLREEDEGAAGSRRGGGDVEREKASGRAV